MRSHLLVRGSWRRDRGALWAVLAVAGGSLFEVANGVWKEPSTGAPELPVVGSVAPAASHAVLPAVHLPPTVSAEVRPTPPTLHALKGCLCQPGDPLCSCL